MNCTLAEDITKPYGSLFVNEKFHFLKGSICFERVSYDMRTSKDAGTKTSFLFYYLMYIHLSDSSMKEFSFLTGQKRLVLILLGMNKNRRKNEKLSQLRKGILFSFFVCLQMLF